MRVAERARRNSRNARQHLGSRYRPRRDAGHDKVSLRRQSEPLETGLGSRVSRQSPRFGDDDGERLPQGTYPRRPQSRGEGRAGRAVWLAARSHLGHSIGETDTDAFFVELKEPAPSGSGAGVDAMGSVG